MNDAEASLLRHGNRHVRLGHRVHGGADDRNIQPDVARDLGLRVGVRGHDFGMRRQEQNVVECEGFGNGKMDHRILD